MTATTTTTPRKMPGAYVAIDCGACDQTLQTDDGNYQCHDCGLDYGDPFDDEAAVRMDDDKPDCNEPAPDYLQHSDPGGYLIGERRMVYICPPCPLAKGHGALGPGAHVHYWEPDYYPEGTTWEGLDRG